MKKSELIAGLVATVFLATGCISSTTGTQERTSDENAGEYNYELGRQYLQNQKYELARDRLERALEFDPRMAEAYMALGMAYEGLDNPRLATQAYENSIKVAPRDFVIQNAYAVFLCRQKDVAGASRFFERAANHPENDDAEATLTNAGLCMLQNRDSENAEKFFRAALERKSTYGQALLQLCLLKYQQQDFMNSRAFLQRYMGANPTTAGVLYLAAEIEGKLGNDSGRADFVNQLLRDFPNSPEARKVLSSS